MLSGVVHWTRRRFLAASAVGLSVAAAGMVAIRTRGYRLPAALQGKLRVLSAWQVVVMSSAAERIVAPARIPEVAGFADSYLAGLSRLERRDLGRLLAYLEHVAPLLQGHARRFSALGEAERDDVLASLEVSSMPQLRAGFQTLKALSMMALYGKPDSWAKIGYSGPVVIFGAP